MSRDVLKGKAAAGRTEGPLQVRPVDPELLRRPPGRPCRKPRQGLDGPVEVAGSVPDQAEPLALFGRLAAQMVDRGLAGPLLVVDLHRIVAHRQDQVGLVGEGLHIAAAGLADNAHPVGVALGKRPFGLHRRDEGDALGFDEAQERPGVSAAHEGEADDHPGDGVPLRGPPRLSPDLDAKVGEAAGCSGPGQGRLSLRGGFGRGDILGQIQMDRPRRLFAGQGQGPAHGFGDLPVLSAKVALVRGRNRP